MSVSGAKDGPILGTAHRGPWRVAFDLWRASGSFRGFVEFAVIGAVVISFLGAPISGIGDLTRSTGAALGLWSPTSDRSRETPVSKGIHRNSRAAGSQLTPTPAPDLSPPGFNKSAPPFPPRLSDLALHDNYFATVPEPLRYHLRVALAAYNAHKPRLVNEILWADDLNDRYVLLLRGLASLALPGPEAATAGIGMLERAAGMGEGRATAILGVLKTMGLAGYERDPAAGREMLERAVAIGDASAARVLGEGYISGWLGSIDPAMAERYLRLASDRGDLPATYHLAGMLFKGDGVAKDEAEAERLFLSAANAGYAMAQTMIGVIRLGPYSAGLTDDPDEALAWFERAAAQGDPHPMFFLGLFYMKYGERIGRLDLPRAFQLFRYCAEQTLDSQCIFAYATAYDDGIGTMRDPVMAYALYSAAALRASSPSSAASRRDATEKKLSAGDRPRATALVTEFLQRKPKPPIVVGKGFEEMNKQFDDDRGKPLDQKSEIAPR